MNPKKKWGVYRWLVLCPIFIYVLWQGCPVKAEEDSKRNELKQGTQEVQGSEESGETEEADESREGFRFLDDKIRISGSIELNFDYSDVSDTEDKDSGGTSDYYVGTADLAIDGIFSEWVQAGTVITAEDVGKDNDDANVKIDQAILILTCPWAPLYFVGGKRVQPFGVFENPLIEDTLPEELYEIDEWGATLGFAPHLYGLDVSFTLYKGQNVIENLENFDTHEYRSGRVKENGFRSFIANVTVQPIVDLILLSAFYQSEPGDGNRNRSVGAALTSYYGKFSLYTEFIQALEREKVEDDEGNKDQNKESAWSVGLVFQPIKSLELAVRYEIFDDGRRGDQDETQDYRYGAGFNYYFLDFFIFTFEYRHIAFEKETGSDAADDLNEFLFQLTFWF